MIKLTPRDYQEIDIKIGIDFFESKEAQKPSLIVEPTGAGKSIVIGGIVHALKEPCLVLQPSKELLEQNHGKLISFGGEAAIFSASMNSKEIGHTTYATLGSIKALAKEFKKKGVKNVIIDEAHHSYSPEAGSMFMTFMKELAPKKVLGFTATPFRLKPYGNMVDKWSQLNLLTFGRPTFFKKILNITPISKMVNEGYWAKLIYECYNFDESSLTVNSTGADYNEYSISKAIKDQNVNNNIYLRIKSLLKEGRKNILVFCDSVENAEKMAKAFGDIGACVTGSTEKKLRANIINAFKSGEIKVVTNFSTLGTGFDNPLIDAVIIGRPTMSLSLFYQWFGRGVRPSDFKENCLLIDFCNNVKRFGRLEDLNFEYIEGYGWGLFSNERLITNTRLDDALPITKTDLRNLADKEAKDAINMEMWFGEHKGKRISEIPSNYMLWALEKWTFEDKKRKLMRSQMEAVLISRKDLIIKT